MKKTLLNSAGVLALTVVLAGPALADDENTVRQGGFNLAGQDFLNDSLNGNGNDNLAYSYNDNDRLDADVQDSGNGNFNENGNDNTIYSDNDNDRLDLDATDVGNHSGNGNGSKNTIYSGNDDDYIDVDAHITDADNDKSRDDDDYVDLDLHAKDVGNNKSTNNYNNQQNWKLDNSLSIDDVAMLVSEQYLEAAAAMVRVDADHGNVETGSVSFGEGTNYMAAGNMTTSNNTGAGTVAQSVSGIQANGAFNVAR